MTWKKLALNVVSIIAFAMVASGGAQAGGINLVSNGSFEETTNGGGQLGYNTDATGWSTNGYNFLFTPGSADTTGVPGQFGNLQLWGPNNGSANGLPVTSPDGGNFVAGDGAYDSGPISQTLTGLTIGSTYQVGFWWAGAQQSGFTGPNTEQWVVTLGSESQSTSVYDNPSHGFSGWVYQTFNYTATSTSEVLSFLAVGTPISPSVPPMSLLDGVSVNSVPEPSAVVLMGLGVLGVGVVRMRRRAKASAV
jgi:hypothetical protein